jgi:hypothetical protein
MIGRVVRLAGRHGWTQLARDQCGEGRRFGAVVVTTRARASAAAERHRGHSQAQRSRSPGLHLHCRKYTPVRRWNSILLFRTVPRRCAEPQTRAWCLCWQAARTLGGEVRPGCPFTVSWKRGVSAVTGKTRVSVCAAREPVLQTANSLVEGGQVTYLGKACFGGRGPSGVPVAGKVAPPVPTAVGLVTALYSPDVADCLLEPPQPVAATDATATTVPAIHRLTTRR